ncbi:hypothetical protein [Pseudomonas sp. Pf153]|uniref:hypothetical protein n=1 Tax=Pseudomonas sp. Pf153 TaxID=1699309 RepID=UPI00069CF22D|nr:hypothetical protein [Pseudomonas sp. Pf153]
MGRVSLQLCRLVYRYREQALLPQSCWWTQAEKTPEELAFCEALIQAHSLTGELNGSVHSPLRHRSMIFDDALLDSLVETFMGSTVSP